MSEARNLCAQDLENLWTTKVHYDAQLPENVNRVPIPGVLLPEAKQSWIVKNLIETETEVEACIRDKLQHETAGIGGLRWRQAFWKRIVKQLEQEISQVPDDPEVEIHEEILYHASSLLSRVPTDLNAAGLKRYHYATDYGRGHVYCLEDEAFVSGGTTGLRTWPAALYLANHMICNPDMVIGKALFELGSGAGFLAAFMRQLQKAHGAAGSSTVVASDFHEPIIRRLQRNLAINDCSDIATVNLDWSSPALASIEWPSVDAIIASDVAYDPSIVPSLAECLAYLLKAARLGTQAYVCTAVRNPETLDLFLASCESAGLAARAVHIEAPTMSKALVVGSTKPKEVCLFSIGLHERVNSTRSVA